MSLFYTVSGILSVFPTFKGTHMLRPCSQNAGELHFVHLTFIYFKGVQYELSSSLFISEVTVNMPYQFAMVHANILVSTCTSKRFKQKNNPDNPLFDLSPAPRDVAIIELLRSAHLLPVPRTRTTRYRSFIHQGLIRF